MPKSKTARIFRPVCQVAAPTAKSAVSDCILFSSSVFCIQLTLCRRHAPAASALSLIESDKKKAYPALCVLDTIHCMPERSADLSATIDNTYRCRIEFSTTSRRQPHT